ALIDRPSYDRAGEGVGLAVVPADGAGDAGVLLLDAGRVGEHHVGQVAGGGGAVDRAVEALADEVGQVAAVVDVGVAEYDRIHVTRVKGKLRRGLRFRPPAGGEAAVQQNCAAGGFDQVHRAGYGPGGAPKGDGRSRD